MTRATAGFLLALLLAAAGAEAAEYEWEVLRVIDGDTLHIRLEGLPPELADVAVRILGVDTPETGGRARCESERRTGERAAAFVEQALRDAETVTFEPTGWDKFGGRIDAIVRLDGQDLGAALIKNRLARPYDGGKRRGWCD
jgi:endonuclease YncB( thermonuclease family)